MGPRLKVKPVEAALIFKANLTEASNNSATLTKSSSRNPLDVRAGVPEQNISSNSIKDSKFVNI